MKLATLKDGTRDGRLIVVAEHLQQAARSPDKWPTLQAALDDWANAEVELRRLSEQVNAARAVGMFMLDETQLMAPLPRAYQWVDGSAYLHHVELVRKARGAEMPPSFLHDPLMYQGVSDHMLGPRDPVEVASEEYGIDLEAEVAVITDDVPMGVNAEDALRYIRLVVLVNDVSLRNLIPAELAKGFGFLHSKPASGFSPVAVTPDALGEAWKDGKLHLPLISHINGKEIGRPNAGEDMQFHFGQLIAHAAKTRHLTAGTIVGSGTVSNRREDSGSSCLAEERMLEIIADGQPKTPFMSFGDVVRVEMLDAGGESIFGAIEQVITPYHPAS